MENIDVRENLALMGESITSAEVHYLKEIIVNKEKSCFNYKDFIEFYNSDKPKQGAFKIIK